MLIYIVSALSLSELHPLFRRLDGKNLLFLFCSSLLDCEEDKKLVVAEKYSESTNFLFYKEVNSRLFRDSFYEILGGNPQKGLFLSDGLSSFRTDPFPEI